MKKHYIRLFTIIFVLSISIISWHEVILINSSKTYNQYSDELEKNKGIIPSSNPYTSKQKNTGNTQVSSSSSFAKDYTESTSLRYRSPINLGLNTYINPSSSSENVLDKKLSVTSPTEGDQLYRGDSFDVSGQLRSAAPNDYWDGETVEIYYNLTESQFLTDPDFYRGSDYFVTSVITDSLGEFSTSVSTSILSADFRSKVGNITIFTWFDGHPEAGRGAGSPGSTYVFIYGKLKFDVSYSVTNPNQAYSFTTRVRYDNDSLVQTSSTSYNLNIEWETAGVHTSSNYSFLGTNQHTYSNTAPGTPQNVTYTGYYDSTQLPFSFFVAERDSSFSTTLLYETITTETTDQVFIDAYYVTPGGLSNDDVEIPLDDYITVYANVTDSSGLVGASYSVYLDFYHGTNNYNSTTVTTNSSGAVEFIHYVDHNNIADITITDAFYLTLTVDSGEFPGSTITPDRLDSILAANITTISITITDTTSFYTSGLSIEYTTTIQDEFSRNAPSVEFQINFPGLALITRTTTTSGTRTVTTIIPSYAAIDQTQTKTITVTAQATTGATYKYYISGGPVQDTDTFNMYYDLQLTLKGPYDSLITDGESLSFFNNTYYNNFTLGNIYNLSVVDQWDRNPIGAPFSINLDGQIVTDTITAGDNFIELDPDFNPITGIDLSIVGTYSLTASAGAGDYSQIITHTIDIYGPDNVYPTFVSENLSPNPFSAVNHLPYFDVNFTIYASDVGTGVRSVLIWYKVLNPDNTTKRDWVSLSLNYLGGGAWSEIINTTIDDSLCYIQYYIAIKDYAGYGLFENGTRQTVAQYNANFGWETLKYNSTNPHVYQIGDYIAPVPIQVPSTIDSGDVFNPYLNITVYVNDTIIFTDISEVLIYINRTEEDGTLEINWINGVEMTRIPGTNAWFYQLVGEYNYEYTWYYVAYDNAVPIRNSYKSEVSLYSVIDDLAPIMSQPSAIPNTGWSWNDTINFSVTVTDDKTGVLNVTLYLNYTDPNGLSVANITLVMVRINTTNQYRAILNLSDYELELYGGHSITYYYETFDNKNNRAITRIFSKSVSHPRPPDQPPIGDPDDPNRGGIGGIVGGAIGGVIALIVILFLWFNRHSLRNYAQKQTLRRRLRDYLREIVEDIKRDGVEGHYKEGVMKTWQVIEGVGREFFDTPRFRHQTTMEYAKILARRGKIDISILNTLTEYFEKARYGTEAITEQDYTASVSALMKIVGQLETGEMAIET